MNREIKFRVWDKEEKEIFVPTYPDEVQFNDGTPHWAGCDEFVAMQFTGLKDKNGKEIYEGDIFKLRNKSFIEEYDSIEFVVWDERFSRWGLKDEDNDIHEIGLLDMTQVEIIGNIYENPELLEEQK